MVWKLGPGPFTAFLDEGGGGDGNLPSSIRGSNTARNQTLLLRFKFSTVVELTRASWIELPAMPSEKKRNRADRLRRR